MTPHLTPSRLWDAIQRKYPSESPPPQAPARVSASPESCDAPAPPTTTGTRLVPAPLSPDEPWEVATDTSTAVATVSELNILDRARPLDFAAFPAPPGKGSAPKSTIPNVAHLLSQYGITARYDVIKKKLRITMPGYSGSPDNVDNVAMTQINSLALLNGMATGPIPETVALIGDRNLYDPVAEWIGSKPWDGIDRLPTFYATLTERDGFPPALKRTLMYRWMVSAVAAIFEAKGFSCRGVLTLQGAQGLGKTKWSAALVSDPALRKQVVKLGHHLDASDKDSQIAAITNWIVEIGELDGSLRRDIARLKGFITLEQDRIRRPYSRVESEYARRTVFCATVNDSQFLVDPTGNSRWWTLPVAGIDYAHAIDMQQLWAQVRVDYERGAQWWLNAEEEAMLTEQNLQHRTESVIRESLIECIDLERRDSSGLTAMTSTQILKLIGVEHPTNAQSRECCGVLRELLGESKRINGQQKWRVPFREVDTSALVALEPTF